MWLAEVSTCLVIKDVKTCLCVQRIVQSALFKSNVTLMLQQAQEEVSTMHPQGCEECILKTPQATPAQPVSGDSGDVSFVSLGCVFTQLSAQWHIRGLRAFYLTCLPLLASVSSCKEFRLSDPHHCGHQVCILATFIIPFHRG